MSIKSPTAPKGMNDVIPTPKDAYFGTSLWMRILDTARGTFEAYGYRQAILPIVEQTALFARGIGEGTDIVSKEMYSFEDRGGRQLTLRPEGTAGAARAYIQHQGSLAPEQRWWYFGPMFRAERPQKGRYRQFYQIGAEFFGMRSPAADAELITMLWQLCASLGLKDIQVRLNSLGDDVSQNNYRKTLLAYFEPHADVLGEEGLARMRQNPLRTLDSKRPDLQALIDGAPDIKDSLSESSAAFAHEVMAILDEQKVPYQRDRKLVRGLDYYGDTIFEFTTTALGAQDAILGGGRYDGLVGSLGGPNTPSVGFAAGVERLALLMSAEDSDRDKGLYLIPMEGFRKAAWDFAKVFRDGGLKVQVDVGAPKIKTQMKRADRSGAAYALVIGENEVHSKRATPKPLCGQLTREVELSLDAVNSFISSTSRS